MTILVKILLELGKKSQEQLEMGEAKRQIASLAIPGNISWRRPWSPDGENVRS